MRAQIHEFYTDIYPTAEEVDSVCKLGQGADTCVWLVLEGAGFRCTYHNRIDYLQKRFREGKTGAKKDGCVQVIKFVPHEHRVTNVEVPS